MPFQWLWTCEGFKRLYRQVPIRKRSHQDKFPSPRKCFYQDKFPRQPKIFKILVKNIEIYKYGLVRDTNNAPLSLHKSSHWSDAEISRELLPRRCTMKWKKRFNYGPRIKLIPSQNLRVEYGHFQMRSFPWKSLRRWEKEAIDRTGFHLSYR